VGERRRHTYLLTIYPALMITLTPGYFWYLSLHPQGPDHVRIIYGGGLSPDFAGDPEAQKHFEAVKTLLDEVNEEDKGCTERVFKGLSSGLTDPGHLSHLERPNYDFARWLSDKGGGFAHRARRLGKRGIGKADGGAGDGDSRHRLAIGVEDGGGDAAHPHIPLLVVEGPAPTASLLQIAEQEIGGRERAGGVFGQTMTLQNRLDLGAPHLGQQSLADTRCMERAARTGTEEGAYGVVPDSRFRRYYASGCAWVRGRHR
jgi:hypothetical protein